MTHTDGISAPADLYTRGLAAFSRLSGTERPDVLGPLAALSPDLARYTIEFGYGEIWSRPGLTPRQRQIATIAALATLGFATPQLHFHIGGALNVGATRREIIETFIHATVYAGFPAALNAMSVARAVFAERPADEAGEAGKPGEPDASGEAEPASASGHPDADRYERGLAVLRTIDGPAGVDLADSLRDLAPDLGRYLIEYVYGDVHSRPGLDPHTRELATIAMCTALGTAAPQLRVRIGAFLNVGGTPEEVIEIMIQMTGYAGFPAALNGVAAAAEVFFAGAGAGA